MSQPRLKSNSAAIMVALFDRGVSVAQAARESGIAAGTLRSLLKRDRYVHYCTASRLLRYFGDSAVKFVLPLLERIDDDDD